MVERQRPEWTVEEIAAHAMKATSITELTVPELRRMASRILNDEPNVPEPNRTDPKPQTRAEKLIAASRDGKG